LLHLKRDEIEAFLTEQLPRRVNEAFASMASEQRQGRRSWTGLRWRESTGCCGSRGSMWNGCSSERTASAERPNPLSQ
jgi:hypothetical protein